MTCGENTSVILAYNSVSPRLVYILKQVSTVTGNLPT